MTDYVGSLRCRFECSFRNACHPPSVRPFFAHTPYALPRNCPTKIVEVFKTRIPFLLEQYVH